MEITLREERMKELYLVTKEMKMRKVS